MYWLLKVILYTYNKHGNHMFSAKNVDPIFYGSIGVVGKQMDEQVVMPVKFFYHGRKYTGLAG